MRLLITTDTVGGVWTYTKELCEGLLERGNQVLLVSMGRLPSLNQKTSIFSMRNRHRSAFRYVATDHSLEWMQANSRSYSGAEPVLLKLIDEFAPDLLHLNQFCYGALPTSVPKVVIAHSDVISWSEACFSRRPVSSPWFEQYLALVRQGLAAADAVVAPTHWMLDTLAANYSLPLQQVVIPNGRSLPAPVARRRRNLQAVTMGRVWDEGKNVRLLEEVRSPMPLLVAGELSLEDEPPFASARLVLLGQLSSEAALELFEESAVYIATSRYEPFGLAPVEAALSGCAILAHDIPSLREVWAGSALYFHNAGELTAHLVALAANPGLLARAAKGARARAQALYSQDAMIEHYLELYAGLGVSALKAEGAEAIAAEVEPVS